jgi:formylglycine-generating enzyme
MIVILISIFACTQEKTCPDNMASFENTTFSVGVANPSRSWHQASTEASVEGFCMDRYEYPNIEGEYPTHSVTFEEAVSLCESVEKRLCSSAEWELACRGEEGRLYSYGKHRKRKTCNTPIEGPGPQGRNVPYTKSGEMADCKTPEGVYDLNGSLSEWVSDPWSDFPEPFAKNVVVSSDTWRTLRGGTMWNHTFYGQDCTSRHGHRLSGWKNMDDGFRCCQDR